MNDNILSDMPSYRSGDAVLQANRGGNGITVNQLSPGDLLFFNGGNSLTRLPIGGSGQQLQVSNGVPGWAAPAGGWSGFRLTLTTATPVTTSDVTSSTLYFTPFLDNNFYTIDSGVVTLHSSAEINIGNGSLSASTLYRVYVYWTGSALALELSTTAAVHDATTGFWTKSGDTSRRWVGMVFTDATTKFNDTNAKRNVCNVQNGMPRTLLSTDSTARTTTSATYSQIGSVQVEYVTHGFQYLTLLGKVGCDSGATSSSSIGTVSVGTGTSTAVGTAGIQGVNTNNGITVQMTGYSDAVAVYTEAQAAGHYTRYLLFAANAGTFAVVGTLNSQNTTALQGMVCN